ncbi:uncharacterized protein LOC62_03G004523 [Vanrija pseudolonga]|uniref:Uncharacterized protein n=1 Tax=Vanrija pseudolonga TaxID=143232 RepID=A0AAF0YBW2_9TREE|nr:hypothetical protein LOC62_03G004523 [Vanrija pseudolonga]
MADNAAGGGIIVGGGGAVTAGLPPTPKPPSAKTTTIAPIGVAPSISPTTTVLPHTPAPSSVAPTIDPPPPSSAVSSPSSLPPPLASSSSSPSPLPSNSTSLDLSSSSVAPSGTSIPASYTPKSGNGLPFSTPVLVGVIVGGVVLIASVLGCCWLFARQRKRRGDDDDAFGMGIEWRRSNAGYTRSDDAAAAQQQQQKQQRPLPTSTIPRHALTSHEARDSVVRSGAAARNANAHAQALAPPQAFYRSESNDRASTAWTDNSEMDVWAVAGSTAGARTMSTVSRPNSEYSLEHDPGSTWSAHDHGTFGGAASHPAFLPPMGGGGGAVRPAPGSAVRSASAPFVNSVHGSTAGYDVGGTFNGYPLTSAGASTFGGYAANEGTFGGSQTGTYVSTTSSTAASVNGATGPHTAVVARRPLPPRLVVDAKGGQWSEPSSALSPAPSSSNAAYWSNTGPSPSSEYQAPYATRMAPRSGLASAASSPATYTGGSAVRPLVQGFVRPMPVAAVNANQLDRPSALPYTAGSSPEPSPTAPTSGSSLSRGMTIIRHADAGVAFQDAVPPHDDDEELHLPPAYGDIYGEPGQAR